LPDGLVSVRIVRSLRRLGNVTESFYIEGRRLLGATMRLGGTVGLAATRPAAEALSAGLRLERAARDATARRLSSAALTALDAALVSRFAEEALDRAMASELARHAVGRALEGPLVDAIADDLIRYAVVERIVDRLLADGIVEHMVGRALDGPELERVVATILDSPAIERLIGQTIESRLADQALARLLDSEELWLLVEEIAESPAVTDAITQQGFGFADEVAGGMRSRSRNADAWLERKARKALRRPPR
jgi:hypothetical protein